MTIRRMVCITALALILSACNIPTAVDLTPTPPPSATPPAATATSPAPTQPPEPTATQPAPPSATPPPAADTPAPPAGTPAATAGTPASTATGEVQLPPESVLILEPGSGSRVTSPVRVAGLADPTFEQSLAVTILLADGTELVTTSTQIGSDVGQRGPYSVDVPFSVNEEQQGFIQVYSISAKDGGVTHLSSVGVTLLPSGAASIQPAQAQAEQIVIYQPVSGDTVSGGMLHVEGFGLASFEQTLVIDVLNEDGSLLTTVPVTVAAPDLGQPGAFSADIPYSVPAEVAGRVQVRDVSPAHGGNSHLASVEVRLMP